MKFPTLVLAIAALALAGCGKPLPVPEPHAASSRAAPAPAITDEELDLQNRVACSLKGLEAGTPAFETCLRAEAAS